MYGNRRSVDTGSGTRLVYVSLEPRQLLTTVVGERTFFDEVPSRLQSHEIVANYRDDFAEPGTNWEYLWNGSEVGAPRNQVTGLLHNPGSFRPLEFDGLTYAVGNDPGIARRGGDALRLGRLGGHPGLQAGGNNLHDRYAIAAFQVAESGFYSVVDSVASKYLNVGDGIDIQVWVGNDRDRHSFTTEAGRQFSIDFDTNLGFLTAGEKIYVAVGQAGNQRGDSFTWDFSIAKFNSEEVGNFRDDFGTPNPSWSYLWNAPHERGGQVTDVRSYRSLQWATDKLTADGNLRLDDNFPAGSLRLNRNGGLTGLVASSTNEATRYAISAFEVSSSGYYAISDSFLTQAQMGGQSLNLVVHNQAGDVLVSRQVDPLQTTSFDTYVGFVNANEKIYVAVGADGDHPSNAFYFDYSIVAEPFLRPDPITNLPAQREVHVSEFGARPNDGLSDQIGVQRAINAAINLQSLTGQAVRVQLDEGTYRFSRQGRAQLSILNAKDIVIQGAGRDATELLIVNADAGGFDIRDSENVIFRDFAIDYEELPFTQGTVEQIIDGNTLLLTVDAGYAAPNDRSLFTDDLTTHRTQFLDADRSGRLIDGEFYRSADLDSIVQIDSNTYRVSYDFGNLPSNLAVGDAWYQVARDNKLGNFRVIRNSGAVTLFNIVSYASPSGLIQGQDNNIVDAISVRVELKDDRLVSVLGDAVHAQRNRYGSWVEGSMFEGLSDDVLSLYRLDTDYLQSRTARNRFAIKTNVDLFEGERVLFFRPDGYREEARIVSVTNNILEVDRAIVGYNASTSLAPLDRATGGSVVRDNFFGRHRAGRGTIINLSPNTTIVGNTFSAVNTRAIATNAYYDSILGDSMIVQGNRFHDLGFSDWLNVSEWPVIETGEGTRRNVVVDNVFSAIEGAAIRDLGVDSVFSDNFFVDGVAADIESHLTVRDRRILKINTEFF